MSVAPAGAALPVDLRIPGVERRLYAFAVDRLIAWGIDLAVAVVIVRGPLVGGHVVLGLLAILATVLLVDLALALLLGSTGTTPGHSLLGLRVVDTATWEPIGPGAAVVRTLVLALATVPFGFGLAALALTTLADPSGLRRGWHDHLVSSLVVDARRVAVADDADELVEEGRHGVVNLTAMRLVRSRRAQLPESSAAPARTPGRAPRADTAQSSEHRQRPTSWTLALDTGERVAVDALVLVGRRPAARKGEQGARLVVLSSGELSDTHVQVVVAADGALVVTDRGSAIGSTLVRRGLARRLVPTRPTTLLDGDVVVVGDRRMTVVGRTEPDPA